MCALVFEVRNDELKKMVSRRWSPRPLTILAAETLRGERMCANSGRIHGDSVLECTDNGKERRR